MLLPCQSSVECSQQQSFVPGWRVSIVLYWLLYVFIVHVSMAMGTVCVSSALHYVLSHCIHLCCILSPSLLPRCVDSWSSSCRCELLRRKLLRCAFFFLLFRFFVFNGAFFCFVLWHRVLWHCIISWCELFSLFQFILYYMVSCGNCRMSIMFSCTLFDFLPISLYPIAVVVCTFYHVVSVSSPSSLPVLKLCNTSWTVIHLASNVVWLI